MKISIVIPTFNSEKYIERCLKSFVGNLSEVEIILCDGLSSDRTLEIAKSLALPSNIKILIFSQKDKGAADAINFGFTQATGEVLSWIGCDDEFTPGALDFVLKFFTNNSNKEWLIGGCQRLNNEKNLALIQPSKDSLKKIKLINGIDQPSSFWRSTVYHKVGKLDDTYRYAFDWDYWCRFSSADISFEITTKILSKYWFSTDNLTSLGTEDQLEEQLRIISKYNSSRLANHFKKRFLTYDLEGFYGREKSFSEKLLHKIFIFSGFICFGFKVRYYSLYWLAEQIREKNSVNTPNLKNLAVENKNHNSDKVSPSALTVVSAANDEYFVSLLSLIGTLKWPLDGSTDTPKIHVWDLGLNQNQRNILNALNVDIEIFSLFDYFTEPFLNAFNPSNDCFAWKSFCILHSMKISLENIIWIDAGAAVTSSLDQINKMIIENEVFLLESDSIYISDFMIESAKQEMKISQNELLNYEIVTTVIGFSKSERALQLLSEWVKYSSIPAAILGKGDEYRHDQSIVSILARRMKLPTFKTSKFSRENYSDLDTAFKEGAIFMFHRRKWFYVDLNSLIDIWNLKRHS